jgi:hypothetical protein
VRLRWLEIQGYDVREDFLGRFERAPVAPTTRIPYLAMEYRYLLRSESHPNERYVGPGDE